MAQILENKVGTTTNKPSKNTQTAGRWKRSQCPSRTCTNPQHDIAPENDDCFHGTCPFSCLALDSTGGNVDSRCLQCVCTDRWSYASIWAGGSTCVLRGWCVWATDTKWTIGGEDFATNETACSLVRVFGGWEEVCGQVEVSFLNGWSELKWIVILFKSCQWKRTRWSENEWIAKCPLTKILRHFTAHLLMFFQTLSTFFFSTFTQFHSLPFTANFNNSSPN